MIVKLTQFQKESIVKLIENKEFYNNVKNYCFRISRIIDPKNTEMKTITDTFSKMITYIQDKKTLSGLKSLHSLKGGSNRPNNNRSARWSQRRLANK